MEPSVTNLVVEVANLTTALETVQVLIGLTKNFYGNHREKKDMLQLIELYIIDALSEDDFFNLTLTGRDLLELIDNDGDDEPPSPTGDLTSLH